jgi:hypothetical protein
MILAVVLVIAAALSLVAILGVALSRSLQVSARSDFQGQIQPLDVDAFRNLADPSEDAYLRRRLPAPDFRLVRRARLHALAAYVKMAGRNAAVLVRIGQSALASSDAPTVEAAVQLVNQSLLLRRNAAVALVRIYLAMAWTNSNLAAGPLLDGYQQLSGAAMLLGRLQNPTMPVRISVW